MVNSLVNGVPTATAVTMSVPYYQLITPGGDTQIVGNFEYRIPIFGPVTMAPFVDVGLDKILLPNQLKVEQDRVDQLNGLFPQASFNNKVLLAPGTQKPRMSAGLELQVMLPVVNAPFRVYYALNPLKRARVPAAAAGGRSFVLPQRGDFRFLHQYLWEGLSVLRAARHLQIHHRAHVLA